MTLSRRTHWLLRAVVALSALPGGLAWFSTTSAQQGTLALSGTMRFVTVVPTEIIGPAASSAPTRVDAATVRTPVVGSGSIPPTAKAVVVTITATDAIAATEVTLFPSDRPRPAVSQMVASPGLPATVTTVVALSTRGTLDLYQSAPVTLRAVITGYFEPATVSNSGRFVSSVQRRLDSRADRMLTAANPRTLMLPVPADAVAVALVVTAVQHPAAGTISVAGTGSPASVDATSFAAGGLARAGFVIVPTTSATIQLTSTADTHVVVDLIGWFTGASAPPDTAGLFIASDPVRLRDTRTAGQWVWANGTIEVQADPTNAGLVWANYRSATTASTGYVVTWAAGIPPPSTSTLNIGPGAVVSNSSITPLSNRGLALRSTAATDMLVDALGYFTGPRAVATMWPLPNDRFPRVRTLGPGQVALTFDDGPHPTTTPQVIDILERAGVGGTFFVIGGLAELYPSTVAATYRKGYSVQSHTYSHTRLTSLSNSLIIFELLHASDVIERATGSRPSCFRPPYGATSDRVRLVGESLWMHQVMWNATQPTMLSEAPEIIRSLKSQQNYAKSRGIGLNILFHDGSGCRSCTLQALPTVIDNLKADGWQFVILG